MDKINVLIRLHPGYGLGDAVQMSAVLRHVVAARPNWNITYIAEEGKHQVGRGIVDRTAALQPQDNTHYDCEVLICLYDTWCNWQDRPNTRVSSALHERFGLPWKAEYGRYVVNVSPEAEGMANGLIHSKAWGKWRTDGTRVIAVHYQGDSSQLKKNLTHDQANQICEHIERMGLQPIILDWRGRSSLPFRRISAPCNWGKDAEMVCAVIRECVAFVGIDSGPSKCASSTDTPALVIWTGHHPAPFHDPAENTTHLVPINYNGLEPVCNDPGVIEWFERHHDVWTYSQDPVQQVKRWLREVLGGEYASD